MQTMIQWIRRSGGAALLVATAFVVSVFAVEGEAFALTLQGDSSGTQDDPERPASQETDEDRKLRLEFQQSRTRQLMGELEDRMFELSEHVRGTAPDDAARLVLGLRRSREDLIVEDMELIEDLITEGDYDEAEERQRVVLFRLNELRELLLSTELDLLLKLERLRKMNRALLALDRIVEENENQGTLFERLADGELEPGKRDQRMRGAALIQGETRQLTEILSADVGEIATEGMAAPDRLSQAVESLGAGEAALGAGDLGAAAAAQVDVAETLGSVEEELREARDALLWELQPFIRRAAIDSVARVRDIQEEINAEVEARREGVEPGDSVSFDEKKAKRLLDLQRNAEDAARDMRQLSEETEFSETVPRVLSYGIFWNEGILESLGQNSLDRWDLEAGQRTKALMDEFLQVLLEEELRWKKNRRPSTRKMIKLISELKGARALQNFLRQDTLRLDGRRGREEASDDLEVQIIALSAMEDGITGMLEALDERYWAELIDQQESGSDF